MISFAPVAVAATQLPMANCSPAQDSEPSRIRFAAADLVVQGRMAEADLLTCEAFRQYPQNEDILVIRALVCEVRQDWQGASEALERLIAVQNFMSPADTWSHWIRVLRCLGDNDKALEALKQAVVQHPKHVLLQAELAELSPQPALRRTA